MVLAIRLKISRGALSLSLSSLPKGPEFIEGTIDTLVSSRSSEIDRAALLVSKQSDECTPWDAGLVSDDGFRCPVLDREERLTDFEILRGNDAKDTVFVNLEPSWRSAGPPSSTLGRPNSRVNSLKVLLVFYPGEVAHDTGDHRIDGSLEGWVTRVDRETDLQRFDDSLSLDALLDKAAYLAGTEPGESGEFVNDHEVILTALDCPAELTILFTTVYSDTRHNVGVCVNDRNLGELRGDVLTALFELPLEVLLGGANAGVDSG